eukprot:GHVS01071622.1.p1 GENE.GHVS01071622.1~~GHVS01071622.1.p1  ORF type:complete len:130 (-),score=5.53 GHVS01071622.1:89-478(-)
MYTVVHHMYTVVHHMYTVVHHMYTVVHSLAITSVLSLLFDVLAVVDVLHFTLSRHSHATILFPLTTTIPISVLLCPTTSHALSSTMFINGSYPLSTPVTRRRPFRDTSSLFSMNLRRSAADPALPDISE